MKTLQLITAVIFISASVISCKQYTHEEIAAFQNVTVTNEQEDPLSVGKTAPLPEACNPDAYEVVLESRTFVNGNWEWVWSVRNPNPGNGNNGTAKDLSHWGLRLAACINWSHVTGAAYSGDGAQWTSFIPVYESEASQNCLTQPVLKFDFGTTGTAKSYYRLSVSQEYPIGTTRAYYKAGQTCCTFNVTGISCESGPVEIVE